MSWGPRGSPKDPSFVFSWVRYPQEPIGWDEKPAEKNFAALRKKATRSLMSPSSLLIMTRREGAEGSPGSVGVSGQEVWPQKGVVRIHNNHLCLSKAFCARDGWACFTHQLLMLLLSPL